MSGLKTIIENKNVQDFLINFGDSIRNTKDTWDALNGENPEKLEEISLEVQDAKDKWVQMTSKENIGEIASNVKQTIDNIDRYKNDSKYREEVNNKVSIKYFSGVASMVQLIAPAVKLQMTKATVVLAVIESILKLFENLKETAEIYGSTAGLFFKSTQDYNHDMEAGFPVDLYDVYAPDITPATFKEVVLDLVNSTKDDWAGDVLAETKKVLDMFSYIPSDSIIYGLIKDASYYSLITVTIALPGGTEASIVNAALLAMIRPSRYIEVQASAEAERGWENFKASSDYQYYLNDFKERYGIESIDDAETQYHNSFINNYEIGKNIYNQDDLENIVSETIKNTSIDIIYALLGSKVGKNLGNYFAKNPEKAAKFIEAIFYSTKNLTSQELSILIGTKDEIDGLELGFQTVGMFTTTLLAGLIPIMVADKINAVQVEQLSERASQFVMQPNINPEDIAHMLEIVNTLNANSIEDAIGRMVSYSIKNGNIEKLIELLLNINEPDGASNLLNYVGTLIGEIEIEI